MAPPIRHYLEDQLKHLGASVPVSLFNPVVDELLYAFQPPVHEGSRQSYGAIVTNDSSLIENGLLLKYKGHLSKLKSVEDMRRVSDGCRTFFCRALSAENLYREFLWSSGTLSFDDEVAAFSLRDAPVFDMRNISPHDPDFPETDLLVVQRSSAGVVRLVCPVGIINMPKLDDWTLSPFQYTLQLKEYCIDGRDFHPDTRDKVEDTFRSMARLAVHILGARRIGATLIVESPYGGVTKDNSNIIDAARAIDIEDAGLCLRDKGHQSVIANLLVCTDGAAIFSHRGVLRSIINIINLRSTEAEDNGEKSLGAARVRSAKLASKHTYFPVIAVSSDGPVRVFNGGNQVRPLHECSSG